MVKGLGRKYCIPASWASRLVSASPLALIPMIIRLLVESLVSFKRRLWAVSLALILKVASIPSDNAEEKRSGIVYWVKLA